MFMPRDSKVRGRKDLLERVPKAGPQATARFQPEILLTLVFHESALSYNISYTNMTPNYVV